MSETEDGVVRVRLAELPHDRDAVARLWLEYLTWGNDEMEARHGFRLPVREAVERDLAGIHKFQPPHGQIVLAISDERACGIGCLQRIAHDTAELKRMYVEPTHRRAGAGRAMLERLLVEAEGAGYTRVRLDSPDFLSSAHALYHRHGFVDIEAYPESEIPDEYRAHWKFMERNVTRA